VLAINEPIPGHPGGKPAGVPCANLTDGGLCSIYDDRPAVCAGFVPRREYCGETDSQAYVNLTKLELRKRPPLAPTGGAAWTVPTDRRVGEDRRAT
jgi:Fe-S-cluster containining protein